MKNNNIDNIAAKGGSQTTTEPATLLAGMKTVLKYARNSALSEKYFNEVKVPMEYLCGRLGLNPHQVTIMAIILERGFRIFVTIDNISDFLGTSNLEILDFNPEINDLMERRFIEEMKARFDTGYVVPDEVYDAFRRNEAFVHKVPKLKDDDELLDYLDSQLSILDDNENEKNTCYFDRNVKEALQSNRTLSLAKTLLAAQKKTNAVEFRVLLLMSMLWIRDNDEEVEGRRFSIVIKQGMKLSLLVNSIHRGCSALVTQGFVKVADNGGMRSKGVFALTEEFRKKLTPDRTAGDAAEQWTKKLTRYGEIKEKDMFYNPEAVGEVDRLVHLLQPQQTDLVLARLRERGMRGGFTCPLYGGPGTGKTETVLQLARQSGRDIYQVDVSQLRSMWYGESEKIVKNLFDEYRRMVGAMKVAPIMFFNEADAIFNRRMQNAERSVDKGENALQNIILQEMETLDGILIATTNLQGNLDPAFERRFLYKLELDKPTTEVKASIWRSMLPDLTEREAARLAAEFDFSGGQIENIVRKRFIDEVLTGETADLEALRNLCRNEQLEESARRIGFVRS